MPKSCLKNEPTNDSSVFCLKIKIKLTVNAIWNYNVINGIKIKMWLGVFISFQTISMLFLQTHRVHFG